MDFPASVFLTTPITTLQKVLDYIDSDYAYTLNKQSVTTAHLVNLVRFGVHAMTNPEGEYKTISPDKFLPYPKWEPIDPAKYLHKKQKDKIQRGPSKRTRKILVELMNKAQIPAYVYNALIASPENG